MILSVVDFVPLHVFGGHPGNIAVPKVGVSGIRRRTADNVDKEAKSYDFPMRRNLAEPMDAGVAERHTRVETTGDSAGDECPAQSQ